MTVVGRRMIFIVKNTGVLLKEDAIYHKQNQHISRNLQIVPVESTQP
jgi:hypothetical protein